MIQHSKSQGKGDSQTQAVFNRDFKYDTLDPLKNEIRILTLGASPDYEDLISCSLKTISIDGAVPCYTALSYVWGDPNDRSGIVVNDQQFQATKNLVAALRHIRCPESPLQVWVDAICINQNDKSDKDHQLPLMSNIFSKAQQTKVWLGIKTDTSDSAVELIESLSQLHIEDYAERGETRQAITDWAVPGVSTPWREKEDLHALEKLLVRDYWFRVWVIQEIARSETVEILCGQRKLSWESLRKATEVLNAHSEIAVTGDAKIKRTFRDGIQRITAINSVRNDIQKPEWFKNMQPDSLLVLFLYHRMVEATDPKDKYFALAGLVRQPDSITSQHKYASSVRQIYMLAAESTSLQPGGALNFLDCAGWPTSTISDGKFEQNLPSWVPDWNWTEDRAIPLLYWQLQSKKHKDIVTINATGPNISNRTTFTFKKDRGYLLASGFIFDTIDGVGFSYWPNKEDLNVQNAWKSVFYKNQEYPTGENLTDVVWRTLVLNIANKDGVKAPSRWGELWCSSLLSPHEPHEGSLEWWIKLWFYRNKDFQINGVRLHEIAQQQRDFHSTSIPATDRDAENLRKAFSLAVAYRRLATTKRGYLLMAPSVSRPGDVVAILADCHVPVVLREREERGHYDFIGTCYVHGIMQGEGVVGLNDDERLCTEFQIR